MDDKLSPDQQAIMQRAITTLKQIAEGRPCICLIGFESPTGTSVISASNLDTFQQLEMMGVMVESFSPAPKGTSSH